MSLSRMRPVADVALAVDRPHWTVRTWARRNRIPSEHRNGHLYVDLVAAAALSEQTGRRNRPHGAA